MKSIPEPNKKKVPVVPIDGSLNKYDDIVLIPDEVKEAFAKFGLPDLYKHSR